MSTYIETQTRKIISSYGGTGSIIETPKGAMVVEEFDKWPFYRALKNDDLKFEDFIIQDDRLLERLKHKKGFPSLKRFLQVPTNIAHFKLRHRPHYEDRVISAKYFPKWFYCNKCERFMHIDKWWDRWKSTLQKHNQRVERGKFIPPVCYHCYDKAKSSKKGKWKKYYYHLEQVRFILTSPTGEIEDLPWERWPNAKKGTDEEQSFASAPNFDFENLCCDNQDLRYFKSSKFSDLAGVRIECVNCKQNNTLSGLFGIRLPLRNHENAYRKPVIRTSNSVYYPIIVNSIYLPTQTEISIEDKETIKKYLEKGHKIDFIYEALFEKYDKELLEKFITGEFENNYEPELSYRLKEFNFIVNPDRTKYPNRNDNHDEDLAFENVDIDRLNGFGISTLTALKKIKITTVQTAYTRQEPLDKDIFLSGENISDLKIQARYTSDFGNLTEDLPAVESYGEGIFIAFSKENIEKWYLESFPTSGFKKRIFQLWYNFQNNDFFPLTKFSGKQHLTQFVLMHTLSHLIIKELEFLCGYPATSINERLFVDGENMHGLLIYTVAGSEGSYGGLVSQASEKNFLRILKSALVRATDCASDPICFHSEEGQGISGLNLAACYSCSLVPETSCEEFNSFLDRALLIDSSFGFYKEVI